jgi:hypothetical protein
MSAIKPAAVSAVQPLHGPTEVGFQRLQQSMPMVVHERVGMDAQTVSLRHFAEPAEKFAPILIIAKNQLALIPPRSDVVPRSFPLNA